MPVKYRKRSGLALLFGCVFWLNVACAQTKNNDSALRARNAEITITLRAKKLALHTYLPPSVAAAAPLVFYSSGSGGWHDFDGVAAASLAELGYPVCGISTHDYLKALYDTKHPAAPDAIGADYLELIKLARQAAGVEMTRPVILAGWSLGAGYAALAASDERIRPQTRGVISISLSQHNETALTITNRLLSRLSGHTVGPSFDVTESLRRLPPLPLAVMQSQGDTSASSVAAGRALLTAAGLDNNAAVKFIVISKARSHSFEDGETEFKQELAQILQWLKTVPPNVQTSAK